VNNKDLMSRADFLRGGFKLLAKHIGKAVKEEVKGKAEKFIVPLLRPPGAIDEVSFLIKCTRCDLCKEECPYNAIQPAGAEKGSAMGTPEINPESQPCQMCEDFPCIRACPHEALVPDQSLKIGTARIIQTKCFAFNGQVCDYCYDCCPEKDKAISMENGKPVVTAHQCTGCGQCEFFCPAPGKAIRILPDKNNASGGQNPFYKKGSGLPKTFD
jgi:ferredoxin-type protein NapG